MADRPLIFSADMVRALLAGRKTQTRRTLPFQPSMRDRGTLTCLVGKHGPTIYADSADDMVARILASKKYPLLRPGDRLWVREGFALVGSVDPGWLLYRAEGYEAECQRHGFDKPYPAESAVRWRSPIHMPRWASRLTLTVTDVRVQRLKELTDDDAIAEGVPALANYDGGCLGNFNEIISPREWYRRLWTTIHGDDAWSANPWCCALTFTVRQGNIDE